MNWFTNYIYREANARNGGTSFAPGQNSAVDSLATKIALETGINNNWAPATTISLLNEGLGTKFTITDYNRAAAEFGFPSAPSAPAPSPAPAQVSAPAAAVAGLPSSQTSTSTPSRFSGLFSTGDELANKAQEILEASGKANDPRFTDSIVGSFVQNGVAYNVLGDGSLQGVIESPTGAVLVGGFTPTGEQATEGLDTRFEQTSLDRALGILANAAIAAGTGLALVPAGVGALGIPGAAAAGAGLTNLVNTADLESALRAAALGGATAFGIEQLFPTDALTAARTATDLATGGNSIDSITQTLVNQGVSPGVARTIAAEALAGSSASQIASDFAGQVTFNAASTAAPASTGGSSNLVNVLGTKFNPASGLFSAGAGSLLGAGIGSSLGTTVPNVNTTAGDTSTNTNNDQSVNVIGGTLGGTAASTVTPSVLGVLAGTGLNTIPVEKVPVTETKIKTTESPGASVVGAAVPIGVPSTGVTSKVEVTGTPDRKACPSPEMLVTLADGTKKPAGELKEGDFVKTQHENTLEWGIYPVIYKEILPSVKRLKIVFDGTEFIGSYNHKFFISADNWKKAEDLKVGDIVSGFAVKSIEQYEEGPVVFITINDAHSYICQDLLSHNKTPILVTPTPPLPPVPPEITKPLPKPINNTNDSVFNPSDILRLLALLGGTRAIGGGGGTVPTNIGSVPPSDINIGSTTPQFGPDYYAAVQQYYNAYMPETPRNVAGPLQQWYENKYGA